MMGEYVYDGMHEVQYPNSTTRLKRIAAMVEK